MSLARCLVVVLAMALMVGSLDARYMRNPGYNNYGTFRTRGTVVDSGTGSDVSTTSTEAEDVVASDAEGAEADSDVSTISTEGEDVVAIDAEISGTDSEDSTTSAEVGDAEGTEAVSDDSTALPEGEDVVVGDGVEGTEAGSDDSADLPEGENVVVGESDEGSRAVSGGSSGLPTTAPGEAEVVVADTKGSDAGSVAPTTAPRGDVAVDADAEGPKAEPYDICQFDCVKEIYAESCGGTPCVAGPKNDFQRQALCSETCSEALSGPGMFECLQDSDPERADFDSIVNQVLNEVAGVCENFATASLPAIEREDLEE